MTTPLSALSSTAVPTQRSEGDLASGLDKDAFMKLLVAQLKYQNPMAPSDGQQYMSQMAVFAQVEKLQQLVESQVQTAAWQRRAAAEALVGREVTGQDGTGAVVTGVVASVEHAPGASTLVLADGSLVAPDSVTEVKAGPAGTP